MKKYQFTGHLSPLPPGVNLPLQLSGEVYLASEVETFAASCAMTSADANRLGLENDDLRKQVATLERSNNRLRQKLDRLQR
jgi:hypothetical protein